MKTQGIKQDVDADSPAVAYFGRSKAYAASFFSEVSPALYWLLQIATLKGVLPPHIK